MRRVFPLLIVTILAVQAAPAHAASGDLDPTFGGGDGVAGARFRHGVSGHTAELAPDGRFVVAGEVLAGRMTLARFLPDGSLDPSFGRDGKVKVGSGVLYDIAILPDGSILGAGYNDVGSLLCRITEGGELDPEFGTAGCAEPAFHGPLYGVDVDSTGRVIVVGDWDLNAFVARYRQGGTLDPSFSDDGRRLLTLDTAAAGARPETLLAAASIADGGLVVTGYTAAGNVAIARLRADGALDSSFGDGGRIVRDFGSDESIGNSVLLQGSRIVVGFTMAEFMGVMVLDPNGAPDPSFGGGDGLQLISRPDNVGPTSIAAFPSGGYAVASSAGSPFGEIDFVVGRLDEAGELVSSFGDDGLVKIVHRENDFATGVGVRPDGRIVVGGYMEGELPQPGHTMRTKFLVFQLLG